jgi:hypothetical protein
MRKLGMMTAVFSLLVVAACGGTSNDSEFTGTITSVTVTCNPTTINSTETSQCSAAVGCTGRSCYGGGE